MQEIKYNKKAGLNSCYGSYQLPVALATVNRPKGVWLFPNRDYNSGNTGL